MLGVLLTVVVLVYLAASVAWSVFLRRYRKTRVRFFGVAASFILSLVGAFIAKAILSGEDFAQGTLIPLIEENVSQEVADLLASSPAMYDTVIGLAVALLVPLVMLLLFVVLNFFAWIVYLLISLLHGAAMKEKDTDEDRPAYETPVAIALAVVQSLLVVMVWMVPIATYAKIAAPVLDELTKVEVFDDETMSTVKSVNNDYVAPLNNNAAVGFFRLIGVSPISDSLSGFNVRGESIRLEDEMRAVTSLGCNAIRLGSASFEEYGDGEKAAMENISAAFDRSKLIPILVSEVVHGATDAWKRDESFIGVGADVITIDESGVFDGFTTTLIDVLHADTAEGKSDAIRADIITVIDLIEILIDSNVLASVDAADEMLATLAGEGVIEDMIVVLGSNGSMKVLIPEITNIGVRAISSTLGVKEDVAAVYDELLSSVAAGLNGAADAEDRVAAVTVMLREAFDDAGVSIEKNVVGFFAEGMVNDLMNGNGGRVIDSDDVRAFFAVYAWNAAESSASADAGDSTQTLAGESTLTESSLRQLLRGTVYEGRNATQLRLSGAGALASAVREGSASALLLTRGLYSAETMTTILVTVEDLILDPAKAAEKITADTVNAEARVLASIFEAADDVMKTTSDVDEVKMDDVADAVGSILDSLVESPTYGKKMTSNLFTAILQSEMIRDAAKIDIKTATNLARRGSEGDRINYSETFSTLSHTVSVMDSMNKNSGKLDDQEIVKLLETINPQSAGMIEEYITPERMEEDYQMEEKQSVVAAPLISNTFGYLADNDVEDYDREAKAINHVMSITMAARDSANDPEHNKSLLGSDGVLADQGETEEERAANVVDAFMASDAVAHSLATTPYEEDPFELSGMMSNNENADEAQTMKDAMVDYYHQPGNETEENREKLINLGELFGLSDIEDIFA